jgi:hypothetical protein
LHDLAGDRRHGRQVSFAGREIALESIAHERVGSIGSARSAAPRIQKQNTPGRPPGSFRPGLELFHEHWIGIFVPSARSPGGQPAGNDAPRAEQGRPELREA